MKTVKQHLETSVDPSTRHDEIVSEWRRILPLLDCKTLELIRKLAGEYADAFNPTIEPATEEELAQWQHDYDALTDDSKLIYAIYLYYNHNDRGFDVFSEMDAAIDKSRGQLRLFDAV